MEAELAAQTASPQSPLPQNEPKTSSRIISGSKQTPSSIYSLTLDEFQHHLFGNDHVNMNKSLGSMNMDEFLANIFSNAQENDELLIPLSPYQDNKISSPSSSNYQLIQNPPQQVETKIVVANSTTQSGIDVPRRQGSCSFPPTLSQKTVEEVWSEIYPSSVVVPTTNTDDNDINNNGTSTVAKSSPGITIRQSTFAETSLEEFLIKAGVVREDAFCGSSSAHQKPLQFSHPPKPAPASQHYPLYKVPKLETGVGHGLIDNRERVDGVSGGGISAYTTFPQSVAVVGNMSSEVYAGRGMGKGTIGYNAEQMLSPLVSRAIGTSHQVNKPANQTQNELDMGRGGTRRRKRTCSSNMECSVEKLVVERRQRRMIKNREAATRSRARKQAYTLELEAALDQLKEENARLNQTLLQEMKASLVASKQLSHSSPDRAMMRRPMILTADKLKMLRRMWSSPSDLFTTITAGVVVIK